MYMKAQTLNISLPANLVVLMDQVAKKQFSSRSDLIRVAIVSYMKRQEMWADIFAQGGVNIKKTKLKEREVERIIDDYRKNIL